MIGSRTNAAGQRFRLWTNHGQTGSNPQVLVNALTAEVGFGAGNTL